MSGDQDTICIEKKNWNFSDLPFRVVIFSIMPYHLEMVSRDEYGEERFSFFGYFSKDPLRKPFFLFPSMSIDRGFGDLYVDVTQIIYLLLEDPNERIIRNISQVSPKMFKLEYLGLRVFEGSFKTSVAMKVFTKLFSGKKCFPIVKSFFFKIFIPHEFMNFLQHWNHADHVWKNLESLYFSCRFQNEESLIGDEISLFTKESNLLSGLKKVEVANMKFHKLTEICVPNATIITLRNIKNLKLIPSRNKVKILESKNCDMSLIIPIFKISETLEEVEIGNTKKIESEVRVDFLFDRSINRLEKLTRLELFSVSWSSDSYVFNFEPNNRIESMFIRDCSMFEEEFLFREFPRIQELALWEIPFFSGGTGIIFSFTKVITKISLFDLPELRDEFFKNHSWNNLQNLSLSYLPQINGSKWSTSSTSFMPKLRVLEISNLEMFDDTFFIENGSCLQNIEYLNLVELPKVEGKNWDSKIGKNLRKVDIGSLENLTDQIFFLEFKQLQIISLSQTKFIEGKKWGNSATKNLEILIINDCINFGNSLFLESLNFPKLRRMELSWELMKGIGKGWEDNGVSMPSLQSLEVFSCDSVSDEAFRSEKVVGKIEYIHIHNSSSIHCSNWGFMNHLSKIRLKKVKICEDFLINKPYDPNKVIEIISLNAISHL